MAGHSLGVGAQDEPTTPQQATGPFYDQSSVVRLHLALEEGGLAGFRFMVA